MERYVKVGVAALIIIILLSGGVWVYLKIKILNSPNKAGPGMLLNAEEEFGKISCEEIEKENTKKFCIAYQTENARLCEDLDISKAEAARDNCYFILATKTRQMGVCKSILAKDYRRNCQETVLVMRILKFLRLSKS